MSPGHVSPNFYTYFLTDWSRFSGWIEGTYADYPDYFAAYCGWDGIT